MPPRRDVFISHAGEDKHKLAVHVYEGLKLRGISAFLDERELEVAGDAMDDMDYEMQTALVGLFLLSPEFALKRYPILEVRCFMRRAGLLPGEGINATPPKLIPVFYRLPVAACRYESAFSDIECDEEVRKRFEERVERGETSLNEVLADLSILARHTGVENKNGARNDDTKEMETKRKQFAEDICNAVTRVVLSASRSSGVHWESGKVEESCEEELHETFMVPKNPDEVVLDFSSAFEESESGTQEAEVLRKVLRDEEGIGIVSVVGGGGVGKSCILRGVGNHEEVRKRFPGGVYFISLGMDASIDTLRAELVRILRVSGGEKVAKRLRDEKDLGLIVEEVGRLVRRGRSLVLIDDIWGRKGLMESTVADVLKLLSEEHGGLVVFTTRFSSIGLNGDEMVPIGAHEAVSEVSRRILLSHSKFSKEQIEQEGVMWVVEELLMVGGGLPVCIAVIGRGVRKIGIGLRVRKGRAWVMLWKKIRDNRESLLRDDVREYKSLTKTITVALDVLEENEELRVHEGPVYTWGEMYRSLCVMKKQMVVPISVLERMWKLNGESEVWMVVEGFASVGLCEVVLEEEQGVEGLRIHDLLHEFTVSVSRNEGDTCEWHKRLLDGYICSGIRGGVREWWGLEDHGYILENVCRHLARAGESRELVSLLTRVEWAALRHRFGGLVRWKSDFEECLEDVGCSFVSEEEKEEVRRGLRLVRDAVTDSWSFVSKNLRELGYQLFGRLGDVELDVVLRFLQSVMEWHPKPWLRPVSRCLPRPGEVGKGEFLFDHNVLSVALSRSPFFAVAGVGKEVVIVAVEGMAIMKRFLLDAIVEKIWVSEDGERALSWSRDDTIREWNISTGEEVRSKKVACNGEIVCTTFSADGRLLVTGCEDGVVMMWSTETGERVGDAFQSCDPDLTCVAISRDGSRIVAGGEMGKLVLWKVTTPAEHGAVITGHGRKVRSVTFSPDGRLIISGSRDFKIGQWDANTKRSVDDMFHGDRGCILCVAFGEDGERVALGSRHGSVSVWDCVSGTRVCPPMRHPGWVQCAAMSASGRYVASGGDDKTLRIWDLDAALDVGEELRGHERVTCLTGSRNGQFFVSGTTDAMIRIWDARSGTRIGEEREEREELGDISNYIRSVAVSPDSRCVVSAHTAAKLVVWDVASRSQIGEAIDAHGDHVECVAYSPDGEFFVSGGDDRALRVWRADNHAPVDVPINRGAHRSQEMFVLLGRLRELMTYIMEAVRNGLTSGASNASAGDGRDEYASDVSSASDVVSQNFGVHDSAVRSVVVSPDGNKIVCGLGDGRICVWDIQSGRQVGMPQVGHEEEVVRLDMAEENEVRSTDYDGNKMRWRLDKENGLVRLDESEVNVGDVNQGWGDVVCRGRLVQLTCGDVTLATLPYPVKVNTWHFDPSHDVLGVGMEDGRVLIFHFER